MPAQRVCWRVNRTGALSGLEEVRDDIEAPAPGEVRVRVRAIGLNFADVFSVLGEAGPRAGACIVVVLKLK